MVFLTVAETATGSGLNIQGQLAGGNAPRAQNAHDQHAEKRCFDLLVHGCSFLVQLPDGRLAGLAAMKLQTPVVNPG